MHVYCWKCSNQFLPEVGPPDREVTCRWCGERILLVGGVPEQEGLAEKWVGILEQGDRSNRERATQVLKRLGYCARKTAPRLIRLIKKRSTKSRAQIVGVLADVTAAPVTPKVVAPFDERDVEQLGSLDPPTGEVIRAFSQLIEDDDDEVRTAVIKALERVVERAYYHRQNQLDWETAYHVILKALRDEIPDVSVGAVKALRWFGAVCKDDQLVPRLIDAFDREGPEVRAEGART
jgi:DNA-directed RNA polymerase subunit RPC12/RpoP